MVAMVITKSTAPDIPTEVEIRLETPKNGHIPKNLDNTMLLTNMADIIMMMYSISENYAVLIFFVKTLKIATRNAKAMKAPG